MIVSTNDDDMAVDAFAAAMKAKLAQARAKGRGGWQDKNDCSQQTLSNMLRAHVEKGDPRDVANFCMFLQQRGEAILPAEPEIQPEVPNVVSEVMAELERAIRKFPTWPTDPLHAVGVLNEEVGELNKAVLQQVYEPSKNPAGAVRNEALQSAAMTIRFLSSLSGYQFKPGDQHEQGQLK